MSDSFECEWEAYDGYVGGARPQSFVIDSNDIEDDMTEADLIDLFEEYMREDFLQKVEPYEKNMSQFLEWAKQYLTEEE